MRILILTPQTPYPPDQGAPIRNFHFIKHLGQQPDNQLTLLSFTRLDESAAQLADAQRELANYCQHIEFVPVPTPRSKTKRLRTLLTNRQPDLALRLWSDEFAARLKQLLARQQFDIIQCEGLELVPFLRAVFITETQEHRRFLSGGIIRTNSLNNSLRTSAVKLILDDHNAEYLLQYRAYQRDRQNGTRRWPVAAYSWLQARRLRRYEAEALRFFDVTLAVSEPDRASLCKIYPPARIEVIPNGIDTAEFIPSAAPEKAEQLIFTGSMDFRPNVDAVVWFGQAIWPLIKKQKPAARFLIVGRRPAPAVKALAAIEGIEITGYVPDPRPYVHASGLYVVPMRMGGGVRFKVLEALALGKALLTTSMGADGINLTPNQHAIIVDSAADFAKAAIELMDNPVRRAELAEAGRAFVVENFDWHKLTPQLDEIYNKLKK